MKSITWVFIGILVFGAWLTGVAYTAPTQKYMVIALMNPSRSLVLALHLVSLSATGTGIMSGGGVICYVPQLTQGATGLDIVGHMGSQYSGTSASGGATSPNGGNTRTGGTTVQGTMECVVPPTFQSSEPTVQVCWNSATPSSLSSASSGCMDVQAGSYNTVPITWTNNVNEGTAMATGGIAYPQAWTYTVQSLNASYTVPSSASAAGTFTSTSYSLQNICTPGETGGCLGEWIGPTSDNPSSWPTENWTVLNGGSNSGSVPSYTSSTQVAVTSTNTITTVVSSSTVTTVVTTTQTAGLNVVTTDPITSAINSYYTWGIIAMLVGLLGAVFVNYGKEIIE